MNLQLSDILILFTMVQLGVFGILLLLINRGSSRGKIYLSLFFFSLAVNIGNLFLNRHAENLVDGFAHFFYLGSPFAFFYAPSFFLYCKSVCQPQYKFKILYLLHFLPWAIYFVYVLANFTVLPLENKISIIEEGYLLSNMLYKFLVISLQLQVTIYITIGAFIIRNFRKRIKDELSTYELTRYSWLYYIFICLLCLWAIDISRSLLSFTSPDLMNMVELVLFSGFLAFCYFFIYKAITCPIFKLNLVKQDAKKNSLSDPVRKQYYMQLKGCMQTEKPYLNPGLTLLELSSLTSIPPRSLSEVINLSANQNFYDFINSYRIQESEKIFKSDPDSKYNILEVLYEVGFNSKSSFNSAFKKNTGMTPTEYRQNLMLAKTSLKKSS